jgi:hypothetical protein
MMKAIIIPKFFVLLVLPCTFYGQVELVKGQILYYPFNNESGSNRSPNLLPFTDAVVMGPTAAFGKDGEPGTAVHFDGIDDVIVLEKAPQVDQVSLSFWFFAESIKREVPLVAYEDHGFGVYLLPDGKIYAYLSISNTSKYEFLSDSAFKGAVWRHFALSFDGMNFKVFLDGVQLHETSVHGSNKKVYYTANELHLGGLQTRAGFFNGRLDEVYLFNRALTDHEIQVLYQVSTISTYEDRERGLMVIVPFNSESIKNESKNSARGTQGEYFVSGLVPGHSGGRGDYGAKLDGLDDVIRFGSDVQFHHFSLSLWLNTSSSKPSRLVSWDSGGYEIFINPPGQPGSVSLSLWLSPDDSLSIVPPVKINDGRWHHLLMSFDGKSFRVVIDGAHKKEANALEGRMTYYPQSASLYIGGRADAENYFFDGMLDNLAIFSRSVSPEEEKKALAAGCSNEDEPCTKSFPRSKSLGGGTLFVCSNHSSSSISFSIVSMDEKEVYWKGSLKAYENSLVSLERSIQLNNWKIKKKR